MGRPPAPSRGRFGRRSRIILLLAILITVPQTVLSAQLFTDVPSTSTYYPYIQNIAVAGITKGCAVGKYCPKDFVTREQMAAFINRAGPRAGVAYFSFPIGNTNGQSPPGNSQVATLPIRTTGWEALLITASFSTVTYSAGTYPCEVVYRFRINNEIVGDPMMFDRFNVPPPNTWETRSVSGQYMYVVPAGDHAVSMTYQNVTSSCSTYPANGTLVVQVIPFAWNLKGHHPNGVPASVGPAMQSNGQPVP